MTPIAANTIGATVQIAHYTCSKFAILATSSLRTRAGRQIKIGLRRIATHPSIDAKGIGIIIVTAIIAERDGNFAIDAHVLQPLRDRVNGGIAIADKLDIPKLIRTLNAHTTIPVVQRERE